MREILFRAKRTDNGEWVEGFYANLGGEFHYILTGKLSLTDGYPQFVHHCVDPATVGQYTGLTDKIGVKIFEGDVLYCGDRIVYVKWHEQCGTFDSQFMRYKGTLSSNGIANTDWKYRAEVIGNIHDNPGLLEVHHETD